MGLGSLQSIQSLQASPLRGFSWCGQLISTIWLLEVSFSPPVVHPSFKVLFLLIWPFLEFFSHSQNHMLAAPSAGVQLVPNPAPSASAVVPSGSWFHLPLLSSAHIQPSLDLSAMHSSFIHNEDTKLWVVPLSSSAQKFWHQGPVSWNIFFFLRGSSGEAGFGMIQHITFIVHLICNRTPLLISQEVPVYRLKVGEPCFGAPSLTLIGKDSLLFPEWRWTALFKGVLATLFFFFFGNSVLIEPCLIV